MSWHPGEEGPTCYCGGRTTIQIDNNVPILICLVHGSYFKPSWQLPTERPDNWPDVDLDDLKEVDRRF